jgi:hypothetical protein
MAYKIVVDIVDPGDGEIKVTHTFWSKKGQSERDAEATARMHYTHHLEACEYFLAAVEEENVIEEEFVIDDEEIPTAEVEEDEEDEEGEEGEIQIFCGKCGKPEDECIC